MKKSIKKGFGFTIGYVAATVVLHATAEVLERITGKGDKKVEKKPAEEK